MDLQKAITIGWVAVIIFNFRGLFVDTRKYLKLRTLRKAVAKAKVILESQIKKQQNAIVLLKKYCAKSQELSYSINLGSNNIFFNYMPIPRYYSSIKNQLNSQGGEHGETGLVWKDSLGNIQRLPQVIDSDILSYNYKYSSVFEGKDAPGFFGTIAKYMVATAAAFGAILASPFTSRAAEDGYPVAFNGPHWATLNLMIYLATNVPFVLCCQIEDGNILPKFASLTKYTLLGHLQASERNALMATGWKAIFFVWMIMRTDKKYGRAIKRWLNQLISSFKKIERAPVRPSIPLDVQIDDENSCIICYDKCRNVIFGSCKHMIVCNRCFENERNPVDTCPYCRIGVGQVLEVKEYRP